MLRSFTGAQSAFYATPTDTLSAVSSVTVGAATAAHALSPGKPPAKTKTKAQARVKGKARPEAQPYLEGTGYAIRARYKGHEIYLSGHATEAGLNNEVRERRTQIDKHGAPSGRGPDRTTAAQALQDYAMARLRFKKGARQEAVRINNYLRAAHLDTLLVTPLASAVPASPAAPEAASSPAKASSKVKKTSKVYFMVALEPCQDERVIPNGLHAHRRAQLTKTAGSRQHRAVLATKKMGSIQRHDMQAYMDALCDEGAAPATMKLEQSLWRVLFNHAFTTWAWASLKDNPATQLDMPMVDNVRTRVMSHAEQTLLDGALHECRNALVAPVLSLLRETAMRASEPLEEAYWGDVDWERRVLFLRAAKAGSRDVPLSPVALQVLRDLGPGEPDERIVKITYDALKKGMARACERAGIKDLVLHDLRRTGATRLALKTGNLLLVKALTGHKTDKMAARYMQVGADDVVAVLHAPQPAPQATPVVDAALPQSETPEAAAPAVPPTFTMEQMQAMAQLAARAAIDSFRTAEQAGEPSPAPAPTLTLVPPPAPDTPAAAVHPAQGCMMATTGHLGASWCNVGRRALLQAASWRQCLRCTGPEPAQAGESCGAFCRPARNNSSTVGAGRRPEGPGQAWGP